MFGTPQKSVSPTADVTEGIHVDLHTHVLVCMLLAHLNHLAHCCMHTASFETGLNQVKKQIFKYKRLVQSPNCSREFSAKDTNYEAINIVS